jgi:hypothetical protein
MAIITDGENCCQARSSGIWSWGGATKKVCLEWTFFGIFNPKSAWKLFATQAEKAMYCLLSLEYKKALWRITHHFSDHRICYPQKCTDLVTGFCFRVRYCYFSELRLNLLFLKHCLLVVLILLSPFCFQVSVQINLLEKWWCIWNMLETLLIVHVIKTPMV